MGAGVKEDKDRGTRDGEGCQEALSQLHPPRQSPTLSSTGVKESVHTHVLVWSGSVPTAGTQAPRAQEIWDEMQGQKLLVSSRCSLPCVAGFQPFVSHQLVLVIETPTWTRGASVLPSQPPASFPAAPRPLQAPVLGLAGESFYLPSLRGLLPLHLFQLAWLCLSNYSPRGLMPAVCTPPPGSCIFYHKQLEQRYLADSFCTLSSNSTRHQSTDPRDNPRGGPQSFACPIPPNKALACSHG